MAPVQCSGWLCVARRQEAVDDRRIVTAFEKRSVSDWLYPL